MSRARTSWTCRPRCAFIFLVAALPFAIGCHSLLGEAPPSPTGVVLVLAAGLEPDTDLDRTPVFRRLMAAGRRFDAAFAPEPEPEAVRRRLAAQLNSLAGIFRDRGGAVALVGQPAASEIENAQAVDAGRLEAWLRAHPERFLVVAAVGGRAPAPPPVAGLDRAARLPRIATGDLPFAARPGLTAEPLSWSRASRQRAEALALERALALDGELQELLARVGRAAPASAVVLVGDPPIDRGRHGITKRPGLFDDTLRSALVIAAPGLARPGLSSRRLVSTRDVVPTLLDLAGLGADPRIEGRSLMSLLADPHAAWPEEVLSSTSRRAGRIGRSARSERFRYIEWPDGSRELYDHDVDPGEHTNLAARDEQRGTIDELARAFDTEREPGASGAGREEESRAAEQRVARPQNVLLVVLDDLNTRVGAWGAPVRTPSIDRLAARGVRFDRAYVSAAMCSPSRVSILTGWRPERTRVWNNQDPPRPAGALPLQEHFATHGATTIAIGKISHFPAQFRWDMREEHPLVEEDEHDGDLSVGGERLASAGAGEDLDQPDGQRALRAVGLLEQHRNRPFFLALGLVRPHRRWIAPARYFGLYPPESIAPVPFPPDDLADVPAIAVKTRPQPLPGLPLLGREPPGLVSDPALRREAIAAYQACVSFADAQVGRVLDALDRLDLWQSTVVVLLGDNGYHLGEHGGLLRKDTLFEEALHVPLIVAAPGLRPAVVRAPVEVMDVYPTIVELAGLPAVAGLDARSLVPQLEEPERRSRRPALSYRRVRPPERGWSIRTDRMRYTLWPDGSEELYEMTGAGASEDLSARPDKAAVKARLRARLAVLVGAGVAGASD